MGRQKAVIKARREAKRVLRRDSRSHKQREEESVTSLVQMGGVEAIGMARDSRDTSPILARNEAQLHYLKAIESKSSVSYMSRSVFRPQHPQAEDLSVLHIP